MPGRDRPTAIPASAPTAARNAALALTTRPSASSVTRGCSATGTVAFALAWLGVGVGIVCGRSIASEPPTQIGTTTPSAGATRTRNADKCGF